MSIVGTELERAHAAWEVAGVPLLQSEDISVLGVRVTSDEVYGREGFLPEALLTSTVHDLGPDVSAISVVASLTEPWLNNLPAKSVLEKQLGEHGTRAITHILGEYGLLAKRLHDASVLCTAVSMVVGKEADRHETVVSAWDDGYPYRNGDLHGRFAGYLLGNASGLVYIDEGEGAQTVLMPKAIVDTAVDTFKGSISFWSGGRRLDIWPDVDGQPNISYGTARWTHGNTMVARLPHR